MSALVCLSAAPLQAQRTAASVVPPPDDDPRLVVLALADLEFGTVLPGIPVSVSPADSRRAGVFEIRGPAGATIRVELGLPAALVRSPNTLPVSFGPGEATAGHGRGPDEQFYVFNPNSPLVAPLSPAGRLFVRLGGTALPNRPQPGGEYEAFITLTVYDLGS